MLQLEGVRKLRGGRWAVDGVSFEARPREVLALVGLNGAGKSTTLGLAAGLIRPEAGRVRVDGGCPSVASVRRRIGLAPQELALYDELTARENLTFFGQLYGLRGRELAARVSALLESVDLEDRADEVVARYSGGMKRRLNLVAALVHAPALVLLDEPTAGVDPLSRLLVYDAVTRLCDGGATVILSTHDLDEAARLADHVVILDAGQVAAVDPVGGLEATLVACARSAA